MPRERKQGKTSIKWLVIAVAAVVSIALAAGVFLLLAPGKEPVEETGPVSKLYWNVDRLDYLKDSDLSSRKAEPDGTWKIRFAVDGSLVEYKVADRHLMNQIDHKDLMGLVFDENGMITGYLEPEDITAGEVARMAYVMKVDGNKFTANTSGTEDGLNIELELSDITGIYDVTGVEPVGQRTTLQVNDRIRGFVNKKGEITHLFVMEREGVVAYDGDRVEKYCAHCDAKATWILWEEADALPNETGHWCLTKNVQCKETTMVTKSSKVVLDLNGMSVTGAPNERVYWLDGNRDPFLAILDQSKEGTGVIAPNGDMDQGGAVLALRGNVELYSGTLDASMVVTRLCGAAVRVEPGTSFTMYGGTIIGGHAKANMRADRSGVQGGFGGAVQVTGGAVFTMYDGVIRDGRATHMIDGSGWNVGGFGGNVHVQATGKFIMEGGQILNGTGSINGGNIYLESGSVDNDGALMEFKGGTISGGVSRANNQPGGNMYIGWKSTLNMSGGTIEKGISMNTGGNVVLYGILNMSGGTIRDGKCMTGESLETAVYSPGVISQNLFSVNGYIDMSGGLIEGGVDLISSGLDANGIDWNSVIKLSGTAQIRGAKRNLYLDPGETLQLGTLENGAYIGITGEGCIAKNTVAKNAEYIHSDDPSTDIYYKDGSLYAGRLSCVCGQEEHIGGCNGELLEWTPWWNTEDLPDRTGNFYLTSDVNMATVRYAVNDSLIRLDLNGKTVTSEQDRIFNYRSEGNTGINLVITDLSADKTGTIKVVHDRVGEQGTILWLGNGNTVELYAGTLDASAITSPGHVGVAVSMYGKDTALRMYGGTIIGGHATNTEAGATGRGGSVWIGDGATFTLAGGVVRDGKSDDHGGNILVDVGASFVMTGGELKDGKALAGGNVSAWGTVEIAGGSVSGGVCDDNGGNFHITPASKLTVSGGVIETGHAKDSGGNVALFGNMVVTGGEIRNGTAGINADSGNVFINQGEELSFTMQGGKIAGLMRVHASESLQISGAAVINGGKTNLCLYNGTILTLGDMSKGADIRITAASGPFAQGAKKSDIAYFSSDTELDIGLSGGDKLIFRGSYTVMTNNILAGAIEENNNVPQEVYKLPIERYKLLYEAYAYYMPDVIAFQEVDWLWHDDLLDNLTGKAESLGVKPFTDLGYVTVAADTKWPPMNNNPLYYNTATMNLIAGGWVPYYPEDAETDTPWSFTWGVFESKTTGERFAVSSTHILSSGWFGPSVDSEPLRQQQIADLVAFMKNIEEEYDCPIILMGDYNTNPSSDAYVAFELGDKLLSARDVATVVEGRNFRTHNVLRSEPTRTDPTNIGVIDHIMISPTGIMPDKYQNLVEEYAEGKYTYSYSDHVPSRLSFRLTDETHTHSYGQWQQEKDNCNAHVRYCECGLAQRQVHDWTFKNSKTVCSVCAIELPESEGKYGCYCAGTKPEGHTCENIYWVPWSSTDSLPYSGGNFYLVGDVSVNKTLYINSGNTVLLDLNGHTVTSSGGKVYNLRDVSNVELIVTDTSAEKKGTIKNVREGVGEQGAIFWIAEGNKVSLYAGTLDASAISSPGHAGVAISMYGEGTTFHMHGGTILGGHATGANGRGGSVWLGDHATFLMTGGTISGGKSDTNGGNVSMDANTTFTMTGGSIENGESIANGGNVYMHWNNTTFRMSGGTISGGTAGGINADNTHNNACGGNVHTQGRFYMDGGIIENGTIANGGSMGGNVSTYGNTSAFYMTDGVIRGGKCGKWGGDNVRIGSDALLQMSGGLIDGTGATTSSVFFESATSKLVLDGNAQIKGATANIVMNAAENKILLGENLVTSGADAAQIWVTAQAGRVLADANVTAGCADVFHVDGEQTNGLVISAPDGYGVLLVENPNRVIPIWKATDELSYVATNDGFTVSWPAARNADSYMIKIGNGAQTPVNGTSYTATGLTRVSGGYAVTITAVGSGGNSEMTLTGSCNTIYDPAAVRLDVHDVLVGNKAGNLDTKYAIYRIPGLVVTKEDTLIAYYEARLTDSDTGAMDILAFRSADGGDTWGDPIMLAAGADAGVTMNNPVIIVGNDSAKTLHFIYTVNYGICNTCGDAAKASCEAHDNGGVFYRKSTDDGLTWSQPVNITDGTAPESRYVIATGPNTGLCTTDGKLIVPVWLVTKEKGNANDLLAQGPSDVATIYSTDGGATWHMGQVLQSVEQIESKTEPTITQLSDGRFMLNIRCSGGWRGVAVSNNGYSGWTTIDYDKELIDPFCHAGFASYNDGTNPYTLLFSNCENTAGANYINARSNLVLKGSIDNGENWTYRKVIEPGDAGYSTIAVDSNGTIYVLYEVRTGEIVRLAKLNYDYLTYDETGCYCAGNGDQNHVCDDTIQWTPWNSSTKLPDKTGNYYLTSDVTIGYQHYPQNDAKIRLDLNGFTVKSESKRIYNLTATTGVELTITDRSASKKGTMKVTWENGQQGNIIWLGNGNRVDLYAGALDASGVTSTDQVGIAISMYGADTAFNMYGGTIIGGYAKSTGTNTDVGTGTGGSVWVDYNASFNMYGGTIMNGRTDDFGGNVWIGSNASFTMRGGTIKDGFATCGGGNIFVARDTSNFTMNGGTISGGKATRDGGNIRLNWGARFYLNGGTITGGTASYGGAGGNYCGGNIHSFGLVTMTGGTIENGRIDNGGSMGGNLSIVGSSFTMTGGTITGGINQKWGGSNVRIGNNATFTISGGIIDGTGANDISVLLENATSKLIVDGTAKIMGAARNVGFAAAAAENYIHLGDNVVTSGANAAQIWVSADEGRVIVNEKATVAHEAVFRIDGQSTSGLQAFCDQAEGTLRIGRYWTNTAALPETSGYYYLKEDVNLSATCSPSNNAKIYLNLNGKTVKAACKVFNMSSRTGIELTIDDSSADNTGKIEIAGNYSGEFGMFVELRQDNIVNLYGGTIDASKLNTSTPYGALITMTGNNTTFNMYDGTIIGGEASGATGRGGSVWMTDTTKFFLRGGTIKNGKAGNGGGNICLEKQAIFIMHGGTIADGFAAGNLGGGNIYMDEYTNGSSFTMHSGTISGGRAVSDGGNIRMNFGTAFVLNNGTIKDGVAGDTTEQNYTCGGNVHSFGTFNMHGGVIENGSIGNGGSMGGNVSLYNTTARFTMTGGIIRGGRCRLWGGSNVRVGTGTFHITGGIVDGTGANNSSIIVDGDPGHLIVDGTGKITGANQNVVLNTASSYIEIGSELITSGENAAEVGVSGAAGRVIVRNASAEQTAVFKSDNASLEIYFDPTTQELKLRNK